MSDDDYNIGSRNLSCLGRTVVLTCKLMEYPNQTHNQHKLRAN